jgi:hypothetical protein
MRHGHSKHLIVLLIRALMTPATALATPGAPNRSGDPASHAAKKKRKCKAGRVPWWEAAR